MNDFGSSWGYDIADPATDVELNLTSYAIIKITTTHKLWFNEPGASIASVLILDWLFSKIGYNLTRHYLRFVKVLPSEKITYLLPIQRGY